MPITASLNTAPTLGYLTYLSSLTGQTLKRTLINEGAAIYKIAASRMKVASQKEIKDGAKFRILRKVSGTDSTLYMTKAGRIWFRTVRDQGFRLAGVNGALVSGWRLGKEDFKEAKNLLAQGKEKVKTLTKKVLANRGLAAGSFIRAVEALGLKIEGVSPKSKRINQAVIAQAKNNVLGSAFVSSDDSTALLILDNISKIAKAQGGARHLAGAVATRRAYFQRNIKRGVFLNAAEAQKAYPNSGFQKIQVPPLAGE